MHEFPAVAHHPPLLNRSAGLDPKLARRHGVFLLVLLPLAGFYLWLNWFDDLGGLRGDGLIYLVTARHYAPYWPADPLAAAYAAMTQFPPVYPALLMVTGGASRFIVAHGVTVLCLVAACMALYGWLLTLDLPPGRAAVGVALFGLLPGTFLQSMYLHPEGLYLAFTFSALVLLARAERTQDVGAFWLAAVAIALALVTRTVGLALLPALAVVLFRARPPRWPLMALVAVAPALLWAWVHEPGWSYGDTLVSEYGSASLGDVVRKLWVSVPAVASGMIDNLQPAARLRWVVATLGALAAAVMFWRLVRWRADAWYLAAYLGMLVLWPYPQEADRLTWPVMPLLGAYLLWLGEWIVAQAQALLRRPMLLLDIVPAAFLVLLVLPGFLVLAQRAQDPLARANPGLRHVPDWYAAPPEQARQAAAAQLGVVAGLKAFESRIPEGECVLSVMPLVAAFYTHREAQFPPWESVGDVAFERQLQGGSCRFLVLTQLPARGFTRAYYPMHRLEGRLDIVAEYNLWPGTPEESVAVALAVLRPRAAGPH